jgi:hypothetical protein
MTPRRPSRLPEKPEGDEGFGLVEAMVSALVLALFSAGIAGLILSTLKTSKIDRMRVAASSLAAREMEIVRDQFARSDADALAVVGQGAVVNPNPLAAGSSTVDGVAYTVTRTAAWAPTGPGASACDGGGMVTYPSVRLSVQVTWPGMRGVRPVTTDSIVTPTKRLLDSNYAFVAVKVKDFASKPSSGRTVVATSSAGTFSQITDASGCAVFGFASLGDYTFRFSEAGFVSYSGDPAPTQFRSVTKGSFQSFEQTYDRAATLAVSYASEAGHALPAQLPEVVVRSAGLPSPGTRTAPAAGATAQVAGLGPYQEGYTVWASSCQDAEPAGEPTKKTVTPVFPKPGETLAAVAYLAPVSLTSTSGALAAGRQVTATHAGACPAGAVTSLTLGSLGADGALLTSLPYGTWNVSVDGAAPVPVSPLKDAVTEIEVP